MKRYLRKIKKRMNTLPEVSWQYNTEKRRPYTHEEMLAKKEEMRYPDQIITRIFTEGHRERVRDFRLNKFEQLRQTVDFNKFETYAVEPFEDVLIKEQDVEFEDVTEEEVTDIEDK